MRSSSNVLVLGSVSRKTLALVRSLGRGGLNVHLAWNDPDCVCLRSRYLRRAHQLPPYRPNDLSWKTALCDLIRKESFQLVIPTSDVDTLACFNHRDEISKYGRLYVPNAEACDVLFDKLRTNNLARSLGLNVPREMVVTSARAVPAIMAEFAFPIVLKPRRTFDLNCPQALLKVHKAYTAAECTRLLARMLEAGPVAAQENFIGQGTGIEMLLSHGEPLLAFQHVRIHEPLHGGQSAYRKSVPLSAPLLAAAARILRAVNYHGVAMVEFKWDPRSGQWVFIEVNARFWGSLPLAVAAGADFPMALYQFLVEGRTVFPPNYRTGLYCRNLTLDVEWQLANLRADRSNPTLATQPLGQVVRHALGNLLTLRERIDTFAVDDPGPFFAECRQLARHVGSYALKMWRARPPAIVPVQLATSASPIGAVPSLQGTGGNASAIDASR